LEKIHFGAIIPVIFVTKALEIPGLLFEPYGPHRARPQSSFTARRLLGSNLAGGEVMTIVPVMWSVWGLLVVVMAGLFLYRSSLTKNEEDQIFLDDSFSHERTAQAAIVAKVNKIQPLVKIASLLVGIATLFVAGYYVLDVINQFK
jgi:hypothetical protein